MTKDPNCRLWRSWGDQPQGSWDHVSSYSNIPFRPIHHISMACACYIPLNAEEIYVVLIHSIKGNLKPRARWNPGLMNRKSIPMYVAVLPKGLQPTHIFRSRYKSSGQQKVFHSWLPRAISPRLLALKRESGIKQDFFGSQYPCQGHRDMYIALVLIE